MKMCDWAMSIGMNIDDDDDGGGGGRKPNLRYTLAGVTSHELRVFICAAKNCSTTGASQRQMR
jgi:hypothetical protein